MKESSLPYFPDPNKANEDGLLAVGGDLSPERLYAAYLKGIFPWYGPDDPILWFSPDPRMLLYPENLKVSKSMRRFLKKEPFLYSCNKVFPDVIKACSEVPRPGQDGTWIGEDMIEAYIQLHELGIAHSVEVWSKENELVGGLYGVSIGTAFFGESMFSKVSNASKAALIMLTRELEQKHFDFVDCQVYTNHLESLGAKLYSREFFLKQLKQSVSQKGLSKEEWKNLFSKIN